MAEIIAAVVCFIAGAFSLICSACNFDWYFNTRKAQRFVRLVGRTGARIFYIVLGIIIMVVALIAICYKVFVG